MAALELLTREDLQYLASIRQDLHRHPELGYKETRTSGVVQRELAAMGIQFKAGLAGGTGVLGFIPATKPGAKTVALRADMDALPIIEETGVPYTSENSGVMHACGHDGHTTMLLGAAQVLNSMEHRTNNVLLVFQPAEEGGAGGKKMLEEGVLRGTILGTKADVIYGQHCSPLGKIGEVAARIGPMMASASQFTAKFHGKGAHAAQPHSGIDPIVMASHVLLAWQTIVSRNSDPVEPVVITVGKVTAGNAHNIIPEFAEMVGTHRTLSDAMANQVQDRIESIARDVSRALGGSVDLSWQTRYPVTMNDKWAHDRYVDIARDTLGTSCVHYMENPTMGGEDFSFYGSEVPANFYFLGLKSEGQETYANLHSPWFDFNDASIPYGVRMFVELAMRPV